MEQTADEKRASLRELARELYLTIPTATLGTLMPETGAPCVTLVNLTVDDTKSLLLCLSGLSLHTRNITQDPRVSLLMKKMGKGDALNHPRLTVFGEVQKCSFSEEEKQNAQILFLKRHPKGKIYVQLPDFTFWRVVVHSVHLNGGFAKAAQFSADEFLSTSPLL
jgi:heme iron utilization protein